MSLKPGILRLALQMDRFEAPGPKLFAFPLRHCYIESMRTNETLRKSQLEKWAIRVRTRHPDKDNYDGVVLTFSRSLVVLQEEENFEFAGVMVLPRTSIKSLRDNKYDKCANEILRQNGQMRRLTRAAWVRELQTVRQTILEVKKRGIWPAIETVRQGESALYIGPILHATQRSLTLRCYDAAGKWEDEYTIAYREIFRIEIWSAYTKHFNAYMKRL